MTRADQLKSLFVSHLQGEDERFMAVAMQVAVHEAKRGHTKLAAELQAVIDQGKMRRQRSALTVDKISPISHKNRELDGLLHVTHPKARLGAMVLHQTLSKQLERVIREQQQAVKILAHGLQPRRKLLLMGPPGTGKTMTASVLAGELGLPLLQVRLDSLITKYMGETSARLRQVFDVTSQTRGLYFFDHQRPRLHSLMPGGLHPGTTQGQNWQHRHPQHHAQRHNLLLILSRIGVIQD